MHDIFIAPGEMIKRPLVMGIVNTAPDSFSDGNESSNALDKALQMLDDGADIIDIGGESTRPGAAEISADVEISRVLGVLTNLKKLRPDAQVSVDTRKSLCAKVFLDNGADIINDVSGLQYSPDMADIAAEYGAYLIIMHSIGGGISGLEHKYSNILQEVGDFLKKQIEFAVQRGVEREKIIIDPGLGFSKTAAENFELLRNIRKLTAIAPVLIGHSRKRFIREKMNIIQAHDADEISALISVLSADNGASVLRVHDVRRTVGFLNIREEMREELPI